MNEIIRNAPGPGPASTDGNDVQPPSVPDLATEAPWAAAAMARDAALNALRERDATGQGSDFAVGGDLQAAQVQRDAELNDRRAVDAAAAAVAVAPPAGEHFLVTQTRLRNRLHNERCRASAHTPAPRHEPQANVSDVVPYVETPPCPPSSEGPDPSPGEHLRQQQAQRDAELCRKKR